MNIISKIETAAYWACYGIVWAVFTAATFVVIFFWMYG